MTVLRRIELIPEADVRPRKGEMLLREFGAAEARAAVQGIVGLLAAEMGGR